jgi:hypothetical protein
VARIFCRQPRLPCSAVRKCDSACFSALGERNLPCWQNRPASRGWPEPFSKRDRVPACAGFHRRARDSADRRRCRFRRVLRRGVRSPSLGSETKPAFRHSCTASIRWEWSMLYRSTVRQSGEDGRTTKHNPVHANSNGCDHVTIKRPLPHELSPRAQQAASLPMSNVQTPIGRGRISAAVPAAVAAHRGIPPRAAHFVLHAEVCEIVAPTTGEER